MYWIKTAAVFIRYLEYELVTGNLEGAAGYKSDIRTIQLSWIMSLSQLRRFTNLSLHVCIIELHCNVWVKDVL